MKILDHTLTLSAALLVCAGLSFGCGDDRAAQVHDDSASALPSDTAGDATPASTSTHSSPSQGEAPPLVPRTSQGTPVNATPGAPPPSAAGAGVTWTLPESWTQQQPSSRMRLAQAAIPGDAGAGELTVFFFGPGQGGDVEANLQRWVGMMEMAPGTEPQRETFESQGLNVTWLDVAGTLKASTMGTGPSTDQPDYRMYAAVIEGPGGPWFFKATGPAATMAAQRDAFVELLRSVRRVGDA